jgi:predicted transcriptional regulator
MERIDSDEDLLGFDIKKEIADYASLEKSVERGLDDVKAGRVTAHEDVMDELRRKVGF